MSNQSSSSQYSKNYLTLIEIANFLRENADKLFDKDSKLSLKSDQLLLLQDYLHQIVSYAFNGASTTSNNLNNDSSENNFFSRRRSPSLFNSKEFLVLYRSNQLHFIQDFLYKITKLKISADKPLNPVKEFLKLNIFGSLTYLEIKNCAITNMFDLKTLRNQLEVLICSKSINKPLDLLHFCGADQSSPMSWPRLHTLNLSHNNLNCLDRSFRLASAIENLDLSHNNLKECGDFLNNLSKLKKLNLSFNKLETFPSLRLEKGVNLIEYLDMSYNSIERIDTESVSKLVYLKHLNLNYNLIDTFEQLSHLKYLPNINQILIEKNPIKNNSMCDSVIHEIIVSNLKNKLNKSPLKPFWTPGTSLTTTSAISINKSKLSGSLAAQSAPHTTSLLNSKLLKKSAKKQSVDLNKRRRRPNNIEIECEQEQDVDFIILSTDSHGICKKSLTNLTKISVSHGTEYESSKLQTELDNMKRMRQNHGDDWLLSTPNLVLRTVPDQSKVLNTYDELNVFRPRAISEKIDTPINHNLNDIVESFLVYRIINNNSDLTSKLIRNESGELTTCILSLNEACLIERDESNTELFSLHEYAEIENGFLSINTDTQPVSFQIRLKFKNDQRLTIYQFDDFEELNSFVECIRKILFNEENLKNCDVYFCVWCNQFNTKSKFKPEIEDDNELNENSQNEFENFTCTRCYKYLIMNHCIQDINKNERSEAVEIGVKNGIKKSETSAGLSSLTSSSFSPEKLSASLGANFTLKDVLKNFPAEESTRSNNDYINQHSDTQPKPILMKLTNSTDNDLLSSSSTPKNSLNTTFNDRDSSNLSPSFDEGATQYLTLNEKLDYLLNNANLQKLKLAEASNECKRINNNLKLYLIINVLNNERDGDSEDETPVHLFKLKNFYYFNNNNGAEANNQFSCIKNTICLFTNRSLILMRILNQELFNSNCEFDKCLKKECVIDVNHIEIIEVDLGLSYLILEAVDLNNQVRFFKFDTDNIYQTQTFLNNLSKTINESKNHSMLKQIRKKNEKTNQNLRSLMKTIDPKINESTLLPITHLTRVHDLVINETPFQSKHFTSEIEQLFVYNNEQLVIIEENMLYLNQNGDETSTSQFNLIANEKINDIVQLRLFEDSESKLEITLVNELNNSRLITWTLIVNNLHVLSQLIKQLKELWEKVYLVELPITF